MGRHQQSVNLAHDVIMKHIPYYPKSVKADEIVTLLIAFSQERYLPDKSKRGMYNRLNELIKDRRVIRINHGRFARPRNEADLEIRPIKKPKKLTTSDELRRANEVARGDLGLPPGRQRRLAPAAVLKRCIDHPKVAAWVQEAALERLGDRRYNPEAPAGWIDAKRFYGAFMGATPPDSCPQCLWTQLELLISAGKIERVDTRIRLVTPRVSAKSYNPLD
jgi:hypothetical protein